MFFEHWKINKTFYREGTNYSESRKHIKTLFEVLPEIYLC